MPQNAGSNPLHFPLGSIKKGGNTNDKTLYECWSSFKYVVVFNSDNGNTCR